MSTTMIAPTASPTVSTTLAVSTATTHVTWINNDRAKTFALRHATKQNCIHLRTITEVASRHEGVYKVSKHEGVYNEGDHLLCTECAQKKQLIDVG